MIDIKDRTAPSIDPEQPMHDAPVERRLDPVDARQGETKNVTRKVLGWGLFLVILAFAAIYIWNMLMPAHQ